MTWIVGLSKGIMTDTKASLRLKVSNESLQIYYSTDLIATHSLSDKRLNYKKEHYTQLLSGYIKNDDDIAALAEVNLRQMDALL